jgi:hypothetical protein
MGRNNRLTLMATTLVVSLFCSVASAEAARKADLLRTWELEGQDTLGTYEGTLVVTNGGRYKVDLSAELTYEDGSQRSWTSTGYYVFGRIYVRYTLVPSGIIGSLAGLHGNIPVRGVLLPNRVATRIQGTYRSDGPFEGRESAYRENRAGWGLRWSPAALERVMAAHGLTDVDALLLEAEDHDDGNGYLKTSELEAAAAALASPAGEELGVISDIDKTVLPPHSDSSNLPAPYPGVVSLYEALVAPGSMAYVTARDASRIPGVPEWMAANGLPEGPIETGIGGTAPWIAQPEKVRDVEKVFAAHPGKRFVLFGDSSHRDPEVYKEIMAKHPDRVALVVIHKVTNTVSANRVVGMHLVEDYAEATAAFFHEGLIDEATAREVMRDAKSEGLDLSDARIEELLGSQ